MDAYATAAGPAVLVYGAEFLAMVDKAAVLVREIAMQSIAIVRFPDVASVKTWFVSLENTACKPFREEAADMPFTLYEAE